MSVQLNSYGIEDGVTGTLVLTVHDPGSQIRSVAFYVTDGSGQRSGPHPADRAPSPGVYEKDVTLDLDSETMIEPVVTLTDDSVLRGQSQSFPRTSGEAITLTQGTRTERGTSVEIGSGLSLGRTADGLRPLVAGTSSGSGTGVIEVQDADTAATQATRFVFQGGVVSVDSATKMATFDLDGRYLRLEGGTMTGVLRFERGNNLAVVLNNGAILGARNAAGGDEAFLWPRWTDNNTYFNFGSGGNLYVRDHSSTTRLRVHTGGTDVTGDVYASAHVKAAGAVYAGGWFRSYGTTGWYSETYGGGWYMADATFIRSYGGKQVWLASPGTGTGISGLAHGQLNVHQPTYADDYVSAITFSREGVSGAQAGIYVRSGSGYGTKMWFHTMNTQNTNATKKGIPTQRGEVVELRKLGNGRVQVGIRAVSSAAPASGAEPGEAGASLLPMPPVIMQYVEVDEDAAPALGERINVRFEPAAATPAAG